MLEKRITTTTIACGGAGLASFEKLPSGKKITN
jgi:hypothetical protein